MTTGNQISNGMSYPVLGCGPAGVGTYFSKTWNGTDAINDADRRNPHPYSCTISSSESPQIQWRNLPSGTWNTGTIQSCFGSVTATNPWTSNDDLKLLNKLSLKIRGNDFNGDAFIAEGHQTLALLTDTAHRLAGFLENVRHGNLYRASKYLGGPQIAKGSKILNTLKKELTPNGKSTGSLANAILEVQYGWRPLLQDAHSFGEALGGLLTKIPVQSYRVTRKVAVNERKVAAGSVQFDTRYTKFVRLIVTVEQDPATRSILHMNDPLAAAWELTPWSFIADWFLPIGDYLSGLNLYRECRLKSIVRTEVTESLIRCNNGGSDYELKGHQAFFSKVKNVNRTLPSVSSNPNNIPLPSFKALDKVFSPEHVLNGIALLQGSSSRFNNTLKF